MTAATISSSDPLQRRRWLAEQADWIAGNTRATELGRRARRAYLDRDQMRNLQRVAETTAAVSTLLDYVKTQTGRQSLWRRESFGPMLLDDLERLAVRAGQAVTGPVHAELCRLFVRQVVAAYMYSIAVDTTTPRPVPPAREAARPPRQRGQRSVEAPGRQGAGPGEPLPDASEPEIQAVGPTPEDGDSEVEPAGSSALEVAEQPESRAESADAAPVAGEEVAGPVQPSEETAGGQEEAK